MIAATTGFGNSSSLRSAAFTRSASAKISAAFSGRAFVMSFRSPPAKKVFLAEATTTPVTESCSSVRRLTAASIESM